MWKCGIHQLICIRRGCSGRRQHLRCTSIVPVGDECSILLEYLPEVLEQQLWPQARVYFKRMMKPMELGASGFKAHFNNVQPSFPCAYLFLLPEFRLSLAFDFTFPLMKTALPSPRQQNAIDSNLLRWKLQEAHSHKQQSETRNHVYLSKYIVANKESKWTSKHLLLVWLWSWCSWNIPGLVSIRELFSKLIWFLFCTLWSYKLFFWY